LLFFDLPRTLCETFPQFDFGSLLFFFFFWAFPPFSLPPTRTFSLSLLFWFPFFPGQLEFSPPLVPTLPFSFLVASLSKMFVPSPPDRVALFSVPELLFSPPPYVPPFHRPFCSFFSTSLNIFPFPGTRNTPRFFNPPLPGFRPFLFADVPGPAIFDSPSPFFFSVEPFP